MVDKRKFLIVLLGSALIMMATLYFSRRVVNSQNPLPEPSLSVATEEIGVEPSVNQPTTTPEPPEEEPTRFSLEIEALRAREYPASEIIIEEALDPGGNYQRYIASYTSDGFRIYGLLTIPDESRPEGGYPAILFLHGFIPPDTYITTADYIASQDGLARSGFLTFKPDLRGHGRSEGIASGAHFSETYVVDTLNALAALETFEEVDPERIGVWGHSNGGLLGLRAAVISEKIRASVFWGGVVGSYTDMLETYYARIDFLQRLAPKVMEEFGTPSENPEYWDKIDPFTYLDSIRGPIQLHHGNSDSSVPVELSISLYEALLSEGKDAQLFQYPGAGHNFYGSAFSEALNRTVEFFREELQ